MPPVLVQILIDVSRFHSLPEGKLNIELIVLGLVASIVVARMQRPGHRMEAIIVLDQIAQARINCALD